MNYNNDEDSVDELNRLLEGLHQAGYDQHFSHLQIVYVAPGAQHVDKIETQRIEVRPQSETFSNPPCAGRGKCTGELPDELATEAAMELWRKAREAGFVDEHYQPTISRTLSAILADEMAVRLEITEKWKTFEGLWNRRNMYRDYYKALSQEKTLTFQDDIKRIFR